MTPLFINWDIDPEIINIFGFSLKYYGLFFVSGLLLSAYILKGMFKSENIPLIFLDKLVIYGILGIFIGARLGHCLFYEPSYFLEHPIEMFLPVELNTDGSYTFTGYRGLASHGGTIGLIISLLIYSIKTKQDIIKTIDFIAIVAPLGAFFIRMANLMNSEMVGIETTVPWGFIFKREDSLVRHPSQLYEAIAYIIIFGLMFFLYKTKRMKFQNGFFFGLSIFLIFIARFFIEFVKEKQVSFENQMTLDMGQLLSIPFLIIGIGFMTYGYVKTNKNPSPNNTYQ